MKDRKHDGQRGNYMNEIKIRPMKAEDWMEISEIYRQGIESNMSTFVQEVPTYEEWNDNYFKECRFVAVDGEKVVGFVGLTPAFRKPAFYGVAELSIYIDGTHQGKGIGALLLNHLFEEAQNAGFWMLQSGIMQNNLPSIKLHEKCGFRMVGYREKVARDRTGNWRNVVLMEKRSDRF